MSGILADVIKYFGFELGAQVTANPSDDRYIINGAHDAGKLQDYLDGFIKKFVLCQMCKNPETDLLIQKDGSIIRDCKACGQRTPVDLRHKLASYITKSPPAKKEKKSKSRKSGKKTNGDITEGASPKESASDKEDGDYGLAGSDDELTKRIKAEAKSLPAGSVSTLKEDWAVDMSEEAIKARAQNLPDDLKNALVIEGEDDDGDANSPYDQLGSWVNEQRIASSGNLDVVQVYVKAKELCIEKKHKTLQVLAQTMFDDQIIKRNQIQKYTGCLKKVHRPSPTLCFCKHSVILTYTFIADYIRTAREGLSWWHRTFYWDGPSGTHSFCSQYSDGILQCRPCKRRYNHYLG